MRIEGPPTSAKHSLPFPCLHSHSHSHLIREFFKSQALDTHTSSQAPPKFVLRLFFLLSCHAAKKDLTQGCQVSSPVNRYQESPAQLDRICSFIFSRSSSPSPFALFPRSHCQLLTLSRHQVLFACTVVCRSNKIDCLELAVPVCALACPDPSFTPSKSESSCLVDKCLVFSWESTPYYLSVRDLQFNRLTLPHPSQLWHLFRPAFCCRPSNLSVSQERSPGPQPLGRHSAAISLIS